MVALGIQAYIGFGSMGKFGSEGYGRGRALFVYDLLAFLLLSLNARSLLNASYTVMVVLAWLIWVMITCVSLIHYSWGFLQLGILEVIYSPLAFLSFYVVVRNRPKELSSIMLLFALLLVSNTYFYAGSILGRATIIGEFTTGMNTNYYVLMLLPWVFLYRSKAVRMLGFICVIAAVMTSMKRTGLIALSLGIITFFISKHILQRKAIRTGTIFAILALCITSFFAYSYTESLTDGYLSQRLSISGSSSDSALVRIDIFKQVWSMQKKSSSDSWLIGHGHNTVRECSEGSQSAHNDWQEVLFDYGLLGMFIYLILHLSLLRKVYVLLRRRSVYGPPMAVSYVLFFVLSCASHLILYASYFAYLMAFWGTMFALTEEKRQQKRLYSHFTGT